MIAVVKRGRRPAVRVVPISARPPAGAVAIPLANGRGVAVVDDRPEVLAVVLGRSWYLGASGYAQATIDGRAALMHRVAYAAVHGAAPPMLDHIAGHRLDNRVGGLRPASLSLNGRNAGKHRGAEPLPLGVFRDKRWFRAEVRVNGATVYLGCFGTADEAGEVYARAARRLLELEAERSALGLAFASDEMPPPPRTLARKAWAARWRLFLTAPRNPRDGGQLVFPFLGEAAVCSEPETTGIASW